MTIRKIRFSTKANNLENLRNLCSEINVLPILKFNIGEWILDPIDVTNRAIKKFNEKSLIIRSSKQGEDSFESSRAGEFLTLQNIGNSPKEIEAAVIKVIKSYGEGAKLDDQVFIQPMLEDVALSGVLFTRDMSSGAPYRVINYSEIGTDAVTSGGKFITKKFTQYRSIDKSKNNQFNDLINASALLEEIFESDRLDIEFGIDKSGKTYVFQVRPLKIAHIPYSDKELSKNYLNLEKRLELWFNPHPYLFGKNTVLGIMPDWNPAEIIGVRPRQLAISLYKTLVTDAIWAYQRSNYGYRNLRSFPLMLNVLGHPYIDVRVSFNSFLPKTLGTKLGEKLVDFYTQKLISSPNLHDKVEFEIVLSCYSFDIESKTNELEKVGFSKEECHELTSELKKLTNEILRPNGIVDQDKNKINTLIDRYEEIKKSNLSDVEKIYWYLEDCKRYGTLPFAGLARASFIAIQLLTSLVTKGAMKYEQYEQFMRSINTVGTQISNDIRLMSREEFIQKYGHLRPGTYDINSKRYDEAADEYFKWDSIKKSEENSTTKFMPDASLREKVEGLIKQHGLNTNFDDLFSFVKDAIEAREWSKFHFTRNLSEALRLIKVLGEKCKVSRDDMSFVSIDAIYEIYSGVSDEKNIVLESLKKGKQAYAVTNLVNLPALIKSEQDIKEFHSDIFLPNYITRKKAEGYIVEGKVQNSLQNKIVFIECADPGYDWIFTHEIRGFVTAYGGSNSHMAIRANELGIPAVVGAGEQLFNLWKSFKCIEINCENHSVRGME